MTTKKHGLFTALEGLTCSGKDLQAARLVGAIRGLRQKVALGVEPTSGPFGSVVRAIIEKRKNATFWLAADIAKSCFSKNREVLDKVVEIIYKMQAGKDVSSLEIQIFFMADRFWHAGFIEQSLDGHEHVVMARYSMSTFAYGLSRGIPLEELYGWHKKIFGNGFIRPDLNIYVRTSTETSVNRLDSSGKIKDINETRENVEATRLAYARVIDISRARGNFLGKIVEVDGEQPVDAVYREIVSELRIAFPEEFKKLK